MFGVKLDCARHCTQTVCSLTDICTASPVCHYQITVHRMCTLHQLFQQRLHCNTACTSHCVRCPIL